MTLVVDVFAVSAIGVLLAKGAKDVWVTYGPRSARAVAGPAGLLIGEHEGLPLEGFHHGLSMSALENFEVSGRGCVVVAPELNLALAQKASGILLAAFRNAKSAVEAALSRPGEGINIVCAAGDASLANVVAAGFLAKRLQQLVEAPQANMDGATLAINLLQAFPDPQEALFQSEAGRKLFRMSRTEDLALASLISVDHVAPVLAETRVLEAKTYGLSQDRTAYKFVAL